MVYADDIIIYFSAKKHQTIRKQLQRSLDSIEKWAERTGFQISREKSSYIHICHKRVHGNIPPPTIGSVAISEVHSQRILGLIFDCKLNWNAHITKLKDDIQPRLNLLRAIAGNKIGGHPKVMLNLYKSVIESKLLFGAPIFCGASPNHLKKLEACQNAAIRLACGAFVTSPVRSLLSISGITPLEYIFWEHMIKHLISIKSSTERMSPNIPSIERAEEVAKSNLAYEIPEIEKIVLHPRNWTAKRPRICWKLKEAGGRKLSSAAAKQIFRQVQNEDFATADHIFTDGSKMENKVGVGIVWTDNIVKIGLPEELSIFSAEAYGILQALQRPVPHTLGRVIYTDSESVLAAVDAGNSRHPWVQKIEDILLDDQNTALCWIPGHTGIHGNEQADMAAKSALELDPEEIPIPADDIIREVQKRIRLKWYNEWRVVEDNKLREIKNNIEPWISTGNRQEKTAINRLRIGHSRITHQHLFDRGDSTCTTCGTRLTVKHLIMDCRLYETARIQHNVQGSLQEILSNDREKEKNIRKYLKDTGLIELI